MKTNKSKRYDAYKLSDVEWLGEIPEHWEIFRIKNITTMFNRGSTPEYVESSNYRVVNQATFSKGYFDWENAKFTSEKSVSNGNLSKAKVKKNDILLASTGGGVLGKVCHLQLDVDNYYADSHVTILRLYSYELSRYIYYFLSINYDLINGILAQGSTNQTELQKSWLGNLLISLPSFPEQTAIAHFLDTKTALIDKAIALKEKQIDLLKERRQAIIHQAVTKGLNPDVPMKASGVEWIGKIPEHWEVSALNYLSKIDTGATPDRSNMKYWNGDIPWVKTGEVNYSIINNTEEYITQSGLRNSAAKIACKDTLLIAMYGQGVTRGRVAILGVDAAYNQACCAISHLQKVIVEYLYNFFIAAYDYFRDSGNETSQMNLSAGYISKIRITIPSPKEQRKIAAFISENDTKINEALILKQQQIQKLKEYKASLINSAVTGKIKVA